jgi:nucleotidyltransferase substrate binding protein (TIGR01987 family)
MIDYGKFKKSLQHLKAQFENYKTLDRNQPVLMQEAVAESVIQRFETCYDSLWKVLKRYMREELGIPEVPNSPKPIFRIASENKLLAGNIEKWLDFADARVATSHDYSGVKAEYSLSVIPEFINEADSLLYLMTDEDAR